METTNVKPVMFKFSEYISEGYELYKNNFGKVFLAGLFAVVMAFIPFCSYLGIGNFFKFLRRLKAGENPEPSEIFNFDDFIPYFLLSLAVFGIVVVMELPIFFFTFSMREDPGQFPAFFPFYMIILLAALYYIMAKAFYMPGLISLKNIKSLKQAWQISSKMASGNVLIIIAFLFVSSLLGTLGVFLCGVGIILTLPFYYSAYFVALEDGLNQQTGSLGIENRNF